MVKFPLGIRNEYVTKKRPFFVQSYKVRSFPVKLLKCIRRVTDKCNNIDKD